MSLFYLLPGNYRSLSLSLSVYALYSFRRSSKAIKLIEFFGCCTNGTERRRGGGKKQVDLRHIDEVEGSNIVDIGMDLSEFYMSVEWDILEVPAVR